MDKTRYCQQILINIQLEVECKPVAKCLHPSTHACTDNLNMSEISHTLKCTPSSGCEYSLQYPPSWRSSPHYCRMAGGIKIKQRRWRHHHMQQKGQYIHCTTVGQVIQSGNLTWFQNHKCTKKLTEIQSLGQYFLDILLAFNWKSLHINFRQLITHNHSYKIITGNRKAVQLTMTFHYHTQISSWLS